VKPEAADRLDEDRGDAEVIEEEARDRGAGEETDTDKPVIWTHLDAQETNGCEAFVRAIANQVSLLAPQSQSVAWKFFERAGSYLLKGFFADGLEQLLWHITTVDALLGEDAPGATKRLPRRVAAILGTTPVEKHLRETREIARAVLVWSGSLRF